MGVQFQYQWRQVPTNVNPADQGTRGLTVDELANTSQWWNGPEFLKRSEDEWPECKFDVPTSEESYREGKKTGSYEITKGVEENADGNNATEGEFGGLIPQGIQSGIG